MNIKVGLKKWAINSVKWCILLLVGVFSIAIFPLGFFMVGFYLGKRNPNFRPLHKIRTYNLEEVQMKKEKEIKSKREEKKGGLRVV